MSRVCESGTKSGTGISPLRYAINFLTRGNHYFTMACKKTTCNNTMPAQFTLKKSSRMFNAKQHYSDIDWNDWDSVIDAFKKQAENWYIAPIKGLESLSGDYAFPIMSICCTLIDALSQYNAGEEGSSRTTFVNFVSDKIPEFAEGLSQIINYEVVVNGRKQNVEIATFAEALYSGLRCGIMHEAHPTLFTVISGDSQYPIVSELKETVTYHNGKPCPTVVVNPCILSARVSIILDDYIKELKQSDDNSPVKKCFKKKFLASYGIEIAKESI